MSLDGFITGPDGDASWMTGHIGPNPVLDDLVPRIGALLVGHRTFLGDDPHAGTEKEGKPFGGGWVGPQFVLTHHVPDRQIPAVTFVGDLASGVAGERAAAADRHINVLGAKTARQCLDAGKLDEMLVFVAPVTLGDGVRLVSRSGGPSVRFEVTGSWFRIVR